MAVSQFFYLDQAGVQQVSTDIFKAVNTRIKERITVQNTELGNIAGVGADDFNDDQHVLSSKAILNYIGNLSNYAAMTGVENTVLGKIRSLEVNMNALTHLTYQVVEGDIETEVPTAEARTDVIYLQHDEPSIWVANDGYVMHDANTRAKANDGTADYYAYYDAAQEKYFKSDGTTVSSTELTSSDTIFDDSNPTGAALVDDNTYNLYIAIPTEYLKDTNGFLLQRDGETPASYTFGGETYYVYWDSSAEKWMKSSTSGSYTPYDPAVELTTADPIFNNGGFVDVEWLCVGDTSLDLANYWSKSDADIIELRNIMFDEITSANITSAVQAAFDATDPYESNGYHDDWTE